MQKTASRSNVSKDLEQFGFKVLGPIAAGAFSTIVKAVHVESKTEVAVKTFQTANMSAENKEERDRELEVLRQISETGHAHIANLMGEYETAGGTHAILLYCGGGSLHSYLAKLRKKQQCMVESLAAVVTAQVCSALQFLHSLGVCHRDVKPGNVLYDGYRWRLCDFGFATVSHDKKLKNIVGTMQYCAPELVSGKGYVGRQVDMWAFGCMLYEMRIGRPAFAASDMDTLKLRIKNGFKGGSENNPWLPHVVAKLRELISSLLVKEAEKRPTAEQVLAHAWVRKHCKATGGGEAEAPAPQAAAAAEEAPPLQWWCDVAGEGCVRPVEAYYPEAHRCWGFGGTYMVCEVCYQSGKAEHMDQLQLIHAGAEAEAATAATPTEQDDRVLTAAELIGSAVPALPERAADIAESSGAAAEGVAAGGEVGTLENSVAWADKVTAGVFERLDADHNGLVSIKELCDSLSCEGESQAAAVVLFDALDGDNDGKLTAAELRHGLIEAGTGNPAVSKLRKLVSATQVPKQTSDTEAAQPAEREAAQEAEGEVAPPPPAPTELELELLRLKEKHQAGSRLEACLMEINEEREKSARAEAELEQVKIELEEYRSASGSVSKASDEPGEEG